MVTVSASADHNLILHLCAFRCCSNFSVLYGVACRFEESECGLLRCCILILIAHAGGVNRISLCILGESNLIAVIGRLRSCPGSVGNRVVDDTCSVSVISADGKVTIGCENRCESATKVLRSIASRLLIYGNIVGIDTDIAVAQSVYRYSMNLIAGELSVAVCLLDGICHFRREGRSSDIYGSCQDRV